MKKLNIVKIIKKASKDQFEGANLKTKVIKNKKDYTRKVKHKGSKNVI